MSGALNGCTCGQLRHARTFTWCPVHDRDPGNTEAAGQTDSRPESLTGEVRPEQ